MTDIFPANTETRYQQFAGALAQLGGITHHASDITDAANTIAAIVGDDSGKTIWTAPLVRETLPALPEAVSSRGIEVRYPDDPAEVRDQPFGLSIAQRAIAETGSVVLIERELTDRVVSLMTGSHIVVCALDDLAPSLDDAGETLARAAANHGSYATLVTGASRTADIERQLTVGVQGPATFHVILVASLT